MILSSLSKAYDQFVIEFKMSGMEKSVSKLHMMLKAVEASMKRAPATILIAQKDLGKGKGKGNRKADVMDGETKPVTKPNPQPAKKAKPAKDAICFSWKRYCKLYMEDLKKQKRGNEASTSGIFVIRVFFYLTT